MSDIRKLRKSWKEIMWNLYSQGASDSEIMVELDLTVGLFEDLYADTLASEFQEAVDYGRLLCRAWWERQGREALMKRGFQGQLWRFQMAARFAEWGDTSAVEAVNETPESVRRKLVIKLAALADETE